METNQQKRKQIPLYKGLIKYFPDALCEVARVSYIGSKQHHPEKEIHWDRDKSQDDLDALMRQSLSTLTKRNRERQHKRGLMVLRRN